MARRLVFDASQINQIEKMAIVGLKPRLVAWILGLRPGQFRDAIRRDREQARAGRPGERNAYLAIQRGRAQGDAELLKVAFDLARGAPARLDQAGNVLVPARLPNVAVLLHLLKSRCGLDGGSGAGNGGDLAGLPTAIIFETQIGDDGVVRRAELPMPDEQRGEDDDERDVWLQ